MKLCQYLNTPKCLNLGGHVLTNLEDSLQAAGVREGDHLTAVAQQVNISASTQAFALWCCGGSKILTWGNPEYGADCSLVQDQLKNVLQIQATSGAFKQRSWQMDQPLPRAIQTIQTGTSRVTALQFRMSAFLLILADGSVVAWVIQSMVATARQSKIS